MQLGGGSCGLAWGDDGCRLFSTARSCPNGHGALPELEPRLFSFNSPIGACETYRLPDDQTHLWHYVAVRGGVDVPPVLGSRSTDSLPA